MLQYVLGIIIDLEGNYISFGKWTPSISFESQDFEIHSRAFLLALRDSGWLETHSNLNLDSEYYDYLFGSEQEIYCYFEELCNAGYSIFLNFTSDNEMVLGYLPRDFKFKKAQKQTLMALKSDLWWSPSLLSCLTIGNVDEKTISLDSLYDALSKPQKQKLRSLSKENDYL